MQTVKHLCESEDYPGFYVSGETERLLVSADGRFIDLKTLTCLLPVVSKLYPYPAIHVRGYGTVFCHRVIAKTFIECPGLPDDLQVNHIDGNKNNFSVANLEWCTASQNALHAYVSGLRDDNRPIEIMDLKTGYGQVFYSMQACSRYFSRNAEAIYRYLQSRQTVPFMGHFNLRCVGQEWKPVTSEDVGKVPNGMSKDVVAISETGQKCLFESYGAASRHTGVSGYRIVKAASGLSEKPINGWLFRFLSLFDDSEVDQMVKYPSGLVTPIPPKRKPIPIVVTDKETGEVVHWNSVEEFANAFSVRKNTLQKALLVNSGVWRNFDVRYAKT